MVAVNVRWGILITIRTGSGQGVPSPASIFWLAWDLLTELPVVFLNYCMLLGKTLQLGQSSLLMTIFGTVTEACGSNCQCLPSMTDINESVSSTSIFKNPPYYVWTALQNLFKKFKVPLQHPCDSSSSGSWTRYWYDYCSIRDSPKIDMKAVKQCILAPSLPTYTRTQGYPPQLRSCFC